MSDEKESDRLYQSYRDYSNNLRSWFVGYGAGLSVFIVGNESFFSRVKPGLELDWLLLLVVIGITAQIALSIINKTINWYCYKNATDKSFYKEHQREVALSLRLIDQYRIDLFADIVTLICFGISTAVLLWIKL